MTESSLSGTTLTKTLSISVDECSEILVGYRIAGRNECDNKLLKKSAVGPCLSYFSRSKL